MEELDELAAFLKYLRKRNAEEIFVEVTLDSPLKTGPERGWLTLNDKGVLLRVAPNGIEEEFRPDIQELFAIVSRLKAEADSETGASLWKMIATEFLPSTVSDLPATSGAEMPLLKGK